MDDLSEWERFEGTLQTRAQELLGFLEKGDFGSAMKVLAELSEARNTMLYQEVGRLTRGLHEAIKEFNVDVENSSAFQTTAGESEGNEVSTAQGRLSYVLELTENSANTTLDMVDSGMPVVAEMAEQARLLRQDWKTMADSEGTMAELRDLGRTTESFLIEIEKSAGKVNTNMTEILLAQGFQDITGQLIKRVIGLVSHVESSLVNLVAVAGQVERMRGDEPSVEETSGEKKLAAQEKEEQLVKGYGPQVNKDQTGDVVASQDDVDDLLSSLGF